MCTCNVVEVNVADRFLPIYVDDDLIAFAPLAIWVFMNYADDPLSARRVTALLTEEKLVMERGEQEDHSHIAKVVLMDLERRTMLGRLSGKVAWQVQQNIKNTGKPNLGKAQFVVSTWADVTKTTAGKPLPSSRIIKEFNRYRDACHLWAAFELLSEDECQNVFQDGKILRKMLLIAAAYQGFFVENNFENYNPWRIPPQFMREHAGVKLEVWIPGESSWIREKLKEYRSDKLR